MSNQHPSALIITHLSKHEVGEDIHIVKETIYDNNTYNDNIRIIKDFKRPFWVTKPIYRTYNDKKESEDLDKVDMFRSTQSDLPMNIAPRLGDRYQGVKDMRILTNSPYLYGTDVDSRTYLKKIYMKKTNDFIPPYRIGTFDIEVDVLTDKLIVATLSTDREVYCCILKDLIKHTANPIERLQQLYEDNIPDVPSKRSSKLTIKIFDNEVDLIKDIFRHANYANIDFLAIWNIAYDIPKILEILERYDIDPRDVFHYDKIPFQYRYFRYKEGKKQKVTESGRVVPINPEEQWHVVKSTTNYYFIDAMSAHRYVRVGGKTVPGGYSLDNILKYEGISGKLKFDTDNHIQNIEWHLHMVKYKPLEYVIYNIWDTMSMLELDRKTKDLTVNVPLLSGVSHFDIFNSGPKRIIDKLMFFYLQYKKVLGVKPSNLDADKILGLDDWIVTLPAYRINRNGLKLVKEYPEVETAIRMFVYDLDAVSSYPSNIMVANVSKDTTHRELVDVEGIDKDTFKHNNIDLMFGATNAIKYGTDMFKLPTVYELLHAYQQYNR